MARESKNYFAFVDSKLPKDAVNFVDDKQHAAADAPGRAPGTHGRYRMQPRRVRRQHVPGELLLVSRLT